MGQLFNANWIAASYICGLLGVAYCVWGRKTGATPAFIGGALVVILSYIVPTTLTLCLATAGILVVVHMLMRMGY